MPFLDGLLNFSRVGLVSGYDQIRLSRHEMVKADPGELPYFRQYLDIRLCFVTLVTPISFRLDLKRDGKLFHVKPRALPHGLQPLSEWTAES